MPFNWNLFPWTKFNEINLDWFLGQFKETQDAMEHAEDAVETINTYDARISAAERNSTIAVQQAGEALATAGDAQEVAEGIEGKADRAIATAGNAVDTANAATTRSTTALEVANSANTTAQGVDAKATQALSDSATALSVANGMSDRLSNAEDDASQAADDAAVALQTANSFNPRVTTLEDEIIHFTGKANRSWLNVDTDYATVTEAGYCHISDNGRFAKLYHYFDVQANPSSTGSVWRDVCYHDFPGVIINNWPTSNEIIVQGIGLTFEGPQGGSKLPTVLANIYSINPARVKFTPITGGTRVTVGARLLEGGTKRFRIWFFGSIIQMSSFD